MCAFSFSVESTRVYAPSYGDAVTVLKGLCTVLMVSTQELRAGTELPRCHPVGIVLGIVLLVLHGTSDSSGCTQRRNGGGPFITVMRSVLGH